MRMQALDDNPGGSYTPGSPSLKDALRGYRRSGDSWSRYLWAARQLLGKRTADIGSGHGLGAAILARYASSVEGFEIDSEARAWAVQHVQARSSNVRFYGGSPQSARTLGPAFQGVVAFEVIEHVRNVDEFLEQLLRLAGDDSKLLLSTPNGNYSNHNPTLYRSRFHVREYTPPEFLQLLASHFSHVELFGQARFDNLDQLSLHQMNNIKRAQSEPSSHRQSTAYGNRLATRLFHFGNIYLNGPLFWRVNRIENADDVGLRYSTILARAVP